MAVEAIDAQLLVNELVVGPEGISFDYSFGQIELEDSTRVEVIVIGKGPSFFLVAVPGAAWDRKTNKRKLPNNFLQKPASFSIAGTLEDDRITAAEIFGVTTWFGWLGRTFESLISFENTQVAEIRFLEKDSQTPCLPHAEALAAVALEKFGIRPDEDVPGQPLHSGEERLQALEQKLSSFEAGMLL